MPADAKSFLRARAIFACFPEHAALRERLLEIALEPAVVVPRCFLIPGVTNAGKSRLAAWLAWQGEPSRVLHLRGSLLSPESILVRIASQLDLPESQSRAAQPVEELLDEVIDGTRSAGVRLLIVDDADIPEGGSASTRRSVASVFKTLMRRVPVNLALMGLPGVGAWAEDRLSPLTQIKPLGRIADSPAYRDWLSQLEEAHSQGDHDDHLAGDEIARALLEANAGFVGFINDQATRMLNWGAYVDQMEHGEPPRSLCDRLAFGYPPHFPNLIAQIDQEWRSRQW